MFDILLWTALEISPLVPYSHFPSEKVCAANWRLAEQYYQRACEYRDTWNSWQSRQLAEQAKREERIWWAMWWVVWPSATIEERHCWSEKVKEEIGLWAWVNRDWPWP